MIEQYYVVQSTYCKGLFMDACLHAMTVRWVECRDHLMLFWCLSMLPVWNAWHRSPDCLVGDAFSRAVAVLGSVLVSIC